MYRASVNTLKRVNCIRPGLYAATPTSTGVDLQDVTSSKFNVAVGTITDGTHTPTLQECNDNSTWTTVAAADQVGTALVALVSNTDQAVSYIGSKRYSRINVVVTGSPSTGGVYTVSAEVTYRKQN